MVEDADNPAIGEDDGQQVAAPQLVPAVEKVAYEGVRKLSSGPAQESANFAFVLKIQASYHITEIFSILFGST